MTDKKCGEDVMSLSTWMGRSVELKFRKERQRDVSWFVGGSEGSR